ncbi:helix-hairpin-helix domain-containing protein [Spirosoma sp. SC4-14]|uniref:ComEA family DNA-binding protein n=1 Tax=Spirosoma sp. SC4-14 TaxID=3128900 RepID=UPI0030D47C1A
MFNRLQSLIRDYFGFSQKESRGFLVLLVLTLLCLLIPFVFRFIADRNPVDTSVADQQKLDSLVKLMQQQEAAQPAYSERTENRKTTAERFNEPRLFMFDPNTVSVAGWQQLGTPGWLAQRIEKYRNKGGRFRKKEDVLRIYNFPSELYQQLAPYMTLSEQEAGKAGSTDAARADKPFSHEAYKPGDRPQFSRPAKPELQPFDINTVDTTQLIALKGIGSKLAGRILAFRDALGGFVSIEQYRDIYGLDSVALAELQKFGQIRTAPRRIRINTASADELDRHPFLSRRQAEIIVRYREQHGAYSSVEALRPIRILDAKTIDKLAPYLEF